MAHPAGNGDERVCDGVDERVDGQEDATNVVSKCVDDGAFDADKRKGGDSFGDCIRGGSQRRRMKA